MSSYDEVIVNECPILPGAQAKRNPEPGWKEIKMPKTKIAVQVVSAGHLEGDAIMLGETYVKQWKIPNGQPVTLRFGSFRGHVKVIPVSRYDGMRIGQSLAKRLGLHGHATLRLHYRPSASLLSLGPLIGVMVSRDYPQSPDKPFGAITQFCRELVDAGAIQGAHVYFFTPNQLEGSTSSLEAWVFADGWRKVKVPAPDVVNNRLTMRKLENKPSVQHFLREVKSRYGTHVFNEKFLDKSEVFDALRKSGALVRYLPESHMLQGMPMLKTMCNRYSSVFLKPVRGSLGKGIIKITRVSPGSYQAHYATSMGTRRQQFPSLAKLYASLAGKMKTVRYQIQQGLNLIEIQGRPVDFRALVQKNASGAWSITSIVARIAGGQHFVSNLARGGTLSTVKDAVARSNVAAGARSAASAKLRRAALDIAAGIDSSIPAHFGELGIDLALDASGRVWLLEVNSKPSKNDNTPLTDSNIRPSVRIMLQYARYLAGF
jgi:glutathione synthase/RimK-type ligase-like ATP-grasp enzyme